MSSRHDTGRDGESAAAEFLKRSGLKVLHRNYRCPLGEIDIIARDGKTVVFVEVRSRKADALCRAEESITATKKRHLVRAATWYLKQQAVRDCPARFDVIAIRRDGDKPEIDWMVNAFEASF
ncbi:MAG: YraN family protein [Desulfobacteraceae bacterium]|nr:YraN family protein [Desulfobacteraceae bacterium]